jgi:hypothetical protein
MVIRDVVLMDLWLNRNGTKSRPRTVLYKEPGMDGCLGGDIGLNRNATMA